MGWDAAVSIFRFLEPVLYSAHMDEKSEEQLLIGIQQWRTRLEQSGLSGALDVVLTILAPLAPLGAQLLYVAQPTLSLFMSRATISALAQLLETPDGLAQLRANLVSDDAEIVDE